MREHLGLAAVVVAWIILGAVLSLGSRRTRKHERRARAQADAMDARRAEPMG